MKLIGKHVLVVAPDGSEITTIAPALTKLGFVILRATDGAAALKLAGSTPLLSLVAVDDRIGVEEGAKLIASAKQDHPELPVVWISSATLSAPLSHGQYLPDAVFEPPFDAVEVQKDVERLLLQHLYPEKLVSVLSNTSVQVVKDAYKTSLTASSVHIRANGNALGEINALLPFCGHRLSGRIVVAGEEATLLHVRSNALGTNSSATRVDAEDIVGEISNLVAGRAKAYFAEHDLSFELGTPILFSGKNTIRYRASRPALVLSLDAETANSPLLISFCFDTFASDQLANLASSPERSAPASDFGDVVFL